MDFREILQQLREERAQIGEAIIALERIQLDRGRRRGRPPKWMQEAKSNLPAPPKRRERPANQSSADAA
jgi:hypothetical protein